MVAGLVLWIVASVCWPVIVWLAAKVFMDRAGVLDLMVLFGVTSLALVVHVLGILGAAGVAAWGLQ